MCRAAVSSDLRAGGWRCFAFAGRMVEAAQENIGQPQTRHMREVCHALQQSYQEKYDLLESNRKLQAQLEAANAHCTLSKRALSEARLQLDNTKKSRPRQSVKTQARFVTTSELKEDFYKAEAARKEKERVEAEKQAKKKADEGARQSQIEHNIRNKTFDSLSTFRRKDDYVTLAGALGISREGTVEELRTRIKTYLADPSVQSDIAPNPRFAALYQVTGKTRARNTNSTQSFEPSNPYLSALQPETPQPQNGHSARQGQDSIAPVTYDHFSPHDTYGTYSHFSHSTHITRTRADTTADTLTPILRRHLVQKACNCSEDTFPILDESDALDTTAVDGSNLSANFSTSPSSSFAQGMSIKNESKPCIVLMLTDENVSTSPAGSGTDEPPPPPTSAAVSVGGIAESNVVESISRLRMSDVVLPLEREWIGI